MAKDEPYPVRFCRDCGEEFRHGDDVIQVLRIDVGVRACDSYAHATHYRHAGSTNLRHAGWVPVTTPDTH